MLEQAEPWGKVLSKNSGWNVRHASRNPYPISEQHMRFFLPISELIQISIPYFRPDCTQYLCLPKNFNKGLKFLALINCASQGVHNNNDRKSFHQKLLTRFTRVLKPYPISGQNGSKTIPFGAAHTFMAYIREHLIPSLPGAENSILHQHFPQTPNSGW